ncbi:hypothetical protein J19TS2_31260 [Cohnella xylanilytica]|uniref:hypothetical protein n=1 Tax=Cohnella xylanilytica TaxID=557555 RepID=UPI001B13956A|nr:hypothetical protein [Cohnella xylanilytica]GIO13571.1 hypothetical protein J19TS2_31260 [Cohnella xylanilytica]
MRRVVRRQSSSEQLARKRAKELGATIRRDNRERLLVVRIGDTVQRFWQGSWPEVVVWLDKQKKQKRKV